MATPTEILNKIDKALSIQKLPKVLQIIRDNTLKDKRRQVKGIIDIIGIKKYKLVFVGIIGTGKTTAISHIFNLIDTEKTAKTIGKGDKKKKIIVNTTKELMIVGSGRTTIAEVVIKATEEKYSFFKIDFISNKVLEELIDSFCEQIVSNNDSKKSGILMSIEVERAFRNILDLKLKKGGLKPELQILKNVKNDKEEFKKIIKKRSEKITKKEFLVIPYKSEQKLLNNIESVKLEKEWVRKTLTKINVANLENFSIPKQIELNLSANILGENNHLNNFNSIIDTQGLDEVRAKKNIDNYLEEEDSICIFTTRYDVAPDKNVTFLMEKHLEYDYKNTHNRFITLMLPRNDEPEKMIGYDGKDFDDWDYGIEYKKDVIKNQFTEFGIKFNNNNILHFDAFRYYDKNLMPEKEYVEYIQEDRDTIITQIENIITYRQSMHDLCAKLDKSVDIIINGKYGNDILEKIKELIVNIKAYQKLIIDIDFAQEFANQFDTNYLHWETKDAINKRHGIWELKDIDLIYDSKELIKEILQKKTIDYKSRITEIIIDFGNDNSNIVYKLIADHLKIDFLISYNNFKEQIGTKLYNRLYQKEFNYHSNFWEKVIEESSKGSGYEYRMLQEYKEELSGIKFFLKKEIELAWEHIVIENIINYLGKSEIKKIISNETIIPKLDNIKIENYFSIDNEGVSISNLGDKNEIYFVGENGSGKTILLQAMARALKGKQKIGAVNDIINENFRNDPLFEAGDNISENKYSNKSDTPRTYKYLYAYGINRLVLDKKENNNNIENSEVYTTLFNNKFSLIYPVAWLKDLKLELDENNDKFITLETVSNLLSSFLEKEVRVLFKGSKVFFEEKGTLLLFEQLSDGYKSSITWISDLLARLSFQQPHVRKLADYKGIVMVDEIGIYLHPKLKFSLIKKLRTKFENIQWIFTTHSPITLLGASEDAVVFKIYKIDKENEKGITQISKPINISGYTANSLITSTIWNIPDFVTAGTELELVSNVDNIYKNIHKLVSEKQRNDPSFGEQDLVSMIKNKLNENNSTLK